MSVIVSDGMSIDQALKLLWREANRENVPATLRSRQYRITKAEENHEKRKIHSKTKRKRRSFRRMLKRRGRLRELLK
jgi:ribosomal protein S21